MLTDKSGERRFSLSAELDVAEEGAVEAIEQFIAHLWTGNRAFAHQHIVEAELPSILTYVVDGTYSRAMKSAEAMLLPTSSTRSISRPIWIGDVALGTGHGSA